MLPYYKDPVDDLLISEQMYLHLYNIHTSCPNYKQDL